MSDRELALFTLCKALVTLLGEEQAIANLTLLYERHPEMFENKEEVKKLIEKVMSEPDIIVKNPSLFSEKDYIVAKKLSDEKMGEVGIRKDKNITKIFHANEKNVKKMKRLDKKEVVYKKPMVGTLTSYTQAQSLDERLVENNISSATNDTISQPPQESQEENALMEQMLKMQESIDSMSRVDDLIKELDENSNANNDESLNNEKAKKPYQSRVRFKKQ